MIIYKIGGLNWCLNHFRAVFLNNTFKINVLLASLMSSLRKKYLLYLQFETVFKKVDASLCVRTRDFFFLKNPLKSEF